METRQTACLMFITYWALRLVLMALVWMRDARIIWHFLRNFFILLLYFAKLICVTYLFYPLYYLQSKNKRTFSQVNNFLNRPINILYFSQSTRLLLTNHRRKGDVITLTCLCVCRCVYLDRSGSQRFTIDYNRLIRLWVIISNRHVGFFKIAINLSRHIRTERYRY